MVHVNDRDHDRHDGASPMAWEDIHLHGRSHLRLGLGWQPARPLSTPVLQVMGHTVR